MSVDVAVVTGASVGIGRAIAARFVAAGARTFALSRRPCDVAGVENVAIDLADEAALRATAGELRAAVAKPSRVALVHNAAMMPQDTAERVDAGEMQRAFFVNAIAPALLTAELRPVMAEGSSVLFIGSTLSEKGVPGRLTYVATKHAVIGLMRATCQDLFGTGIHTACICPGFTDTEMLRPVLDANPEVREAVLRMVSYHRLIDPDEIAELVELTAGRPVLNGAVIHANLGQREA